MKNKTKTITRRLIAAVLIIGLTACAAGIGINVIVRATAAEDIIYSFTGKEDIPAETAEELKAFDADCVMILGAGIEDANTPSPMLKDRLDAGIELYHAGVAPKILLTGDNGSVGHNEIHVMLSYAMQAGVLAGYPVVDVKVTLWDGSYHEVDSSEMAFSIAGSMAFKEAMRKADPIITEPIMKVAVIVPDEYLGDVIGDLNARRGQIQGMEAMAGTQRVNAMVPLAQMFGYATDLRSKTQGRGQYVMEPSHYEPVPKNIADQIIAGRTKE